MKLLPNWIIPDTLPAYRDGESKTAIEQTYKVYQAMQDLINEYNAFAEGINTKLTEFKTQYEEDIEVFTTSLRQEFQDFIDTIDIKISTLEETLTASIKEQLEPQIQATINEMTSAINNSIIDLETITSENKGKIDDLEQTIGNHEERIAILENGSSESENTEANIYINLSSYERLSVFDDDELNTKLASVIGENGINNVFNSIYVNFADYVQGYHLVNTIVNDGGAITLKGSFDINDNISEFKLFRDALSTSWELTFISASSSDSHTHENKDVLDSITGFKTINGQNILGSGNIKTYNNEDIITRYEPVNKKIFEGKKLWVFGDSITAGVGTTDPYYFPTILGESLGCTSITRRGNSGYAFSHGIDDYGYCILDRIETVNGLSGAPGNCDILIICFGVNDWTWGRNVEGDRAIGNLFDTTKYTICGAVNLFCQKLQTMFADYPDVKIYFSTPTPTKNAPISGGNPNTQTWDQSKKNYNGNTLRDICNAIIKTATLYGYQSLDLNLYFDGDINDHDAMDTAFPDGLHPNEEGQTKIANTLEKLLVANPITAFTFNPLVTVLSPLAKNIIYKELIVEEPEEPEETVEPVEPTITTQPVSATYELGATATALQIQASVSDGGTLTYQWYKNGSVISGATSTSYTPDISASGSNSYYCIVTNTLNGNIKTKTSNTITITVNATDTPTIDTVDLSTLSLQHLHLSNSDSKDNLTYNTTTHELSVANSGWYKSSYFAQPLQVGMEVEFTTQYNLSNVNGNSFGIYTEDDVLNPVAKNNTFWPGHSIFGSYAPASDTEILSQWDALSAKKQIKNSSGVGYTSDALNDGQNVKIKLTNNGLELYINNDKAIIPVVSQLSENTNYYLGFHNNTTTNPSSTVAQTILYMGPIR